MELRSLGKQGPRVTEIGICPGEGPQREAVVRRALELGCRLFWSERPIPGAVTLPGPDAALIRYNLLDQKEANEALARAARAGRGALAVHVLAGGALAGRGGREEDRAWIDQLRKLAHPGRSLAQTAIQFVLANESVAAALVRVSTPAHLEEVLTAADAPPLTGRDLEQIFELWANRFE